MVWIDLGLDVQSHVRITRTAHECDDLGERRYARTGDRDLIRKLRRIGAAGPNSSDVVPLDLGEREPHIWNPRRRHIAPIGAAREVRIEPALVGDHDHVIARDAHVELERVHAHRQRIRKRCQRVFRTQRASAAVGFDVEHDGISCKRGCRG